MTNDNETSQRLAIVSTDWRAIADRLASRLIHHAYCDQHPSITTDCPFCADIAAFEEYQKAGGTMRAASIDGPTVAVQDVPRGDGYGRIEAPDA